MVRILKVAAIFCMLSACVAQNVSHGGSGLQVDTAYLPQAIVGTPYSAALAASGGTPPYKFFMVSDSPLGLPPGLGIQPGSTPGAFAIQGTPTKVGAFQIEIVVNDSAQDVAHRFVPLTIAANNEPLPTPPQAEVNTTWNPPASQMQVGCAHNLAQDAANLQAAFDAAPVGVAIVLPPGCVYSGNFTLPAKTNPQNLWTYIQTANAAQLPAPGTRVSPADQPNMPTITTPNTTCPVALQPGANHYRLVGLEVSSSSTLGANTSLSPPSNNFSWCLIGYDSALGPNLPDSIVLDRLYLHGSDTQDVGQGVQLNVTNGALIDSYCSDIHESTFDSQCVLAYYTPGPLKVQNNYLSSGGEDMMLGGAGDYDNPFVPSDVEIVHNTLANPLSWEICGVHGTVPNGALLADGTACTVNNQWIVKNNLELKSARRVAVKGNTLQGAWMSAQTGYSLLLTVRTSQSGNNAVVDDIDVEDNLFQNVDSGFSLIEQDSLCGSQYGYPNCTNAGETKRTRFYNNLLLLRPSLDTYQHAAWKLDGGDGVHSGQSDYILDHNTALMSDQSTLWSAIYFALPQLSWGCTSPEGFSSTHNGWIVNNALANQPDGDCGWVSTGGVAGLTGYMGDPSPLNPRFFGNVLFAPGRAYSFPPDNDVVTAPFAYVNPGAGDYQLQTPSWTDTTDGKVSGIDWTSLQQALSQ